MHSATPVTTPAPITPYSAPLRALRPPAPALSLDTRSVSMGDQGQRVTVRYRHGRAPTLDLRRFSDLDLLPEKSSTDAIEEGHSPELKAKTLPTHMYYPESVYTPATASSYNFSFVNSRVPPSSRYTIAAAANLASSKTNDKGRPLRKSTQTFTSRTDTLDLLQALTTEFPGVPGVSPNRRSMSESIAPSMAADSDVDTFMEIGGLSRSGSLMRSESGRTTNSTTHLIRRSSSRKRKPVPQYDEDELRGVRPETPGLDPIPQEPDVPPLPQSAKVKLPSSPRPNSRRQAAQGKDQEQLLPPPVARTPQGSVLEFPWVQPGGDVVEEGKAELDDAWRKSGVGRIKSMGRAPQRLTPTPSQSEFSRESVVASWYEGPGDSDSATHPLPPLSAVGNAV